MTYINYAHRGASSYAPENTLRAFYQGLEMGANGIETDIQRTRDGKLVLFHDDTLERIVGTKGSISDFTYDELARMDFGRFMGPAYANERIVTLEDFLRYFGNKGLHLSLEIKQAGVEEDSIRLVEQYAQNSHVIFTSFLWESIVALRQCSQQAKIGYLTYRISDEVLNLLEWHRIEQICPVISLTNASEVALAKSRGFSVRFWGIKNEDLMKKALSLDGEGMTVNYPDKLFAALESASLS